MSLQATIARTLLKLPAGLLVRMSGGEPVVVRGWTLDPQLQFLAHGAKSQPPMSSLTAEQGRAASAAGLAMFAARPEPGVATRDFTLERADGPDVPVRLYTPQDQDPAAPMMVFFHFGGGVIGDLETCHAFCSMIASIARCAVLSVDYRLAPEHRWPACLEDCLSAARAILASAPGPLVLAGESAGAHLAAAALLALRAEGLADRVAGAALAYGIYDLRGTPSLRNWGGRFLILSTPIVDWFVGNLLGEGDRADPAASPLLADLSEMPPALFQVGTADPLLDDTLFMAARWRAAGARAVLDIAPGGVHAYDQFDLGIAEQAASRRAAFLRSRLAAA